MWWISIEIPIGATVFSAADLVGLLPEEAHVGPGHGHGLGPGEALRPAHGLLHLPLGGKMSSGDQGGGGREGGREGGRTNTCIVLSFGCLVNSATPGTPSMNLPPLLGMGPPPLLPLLPLLLPSRARGSPSSSTVGSWGRQGSSSCLVGELFSPPRSTNQAAPGPGERPPRPHIACKGPAQLTMSAVQIENVAK